MTKCPTYKTIRLVPSTLTGTHSETAVQTPRGMRGVAVRFSAAFREPRRGGGIANLGLRGLVHPPALPLDAIPPKAVLGPEIMDSLVLGRIQKSDTSLRT